MRVLGIETATDVCAVGLVDGPRDLVDLALLKPRGHGARLAGLIEAALSAAGLTTADLDTVAVSAGPGSYTGLRIGVSTAKGLCLATGASLVAVPTLEALARSAASSRLALAALPSRRGEIYAAVYEADGTTVCEPTALPLADLEAWLPDAPDLVVTGPASGAVLDAVTRGLTPIPGRPSGLTIARFGRQRAEAGHVNDVAAFEPAYLKPFVSGGGPA
ncbi:MAG TPA: tRNA (adenosine(37)-N6)-threonylcarbamoyltransferase complex dimerization subunit type 1 TsaB [Bacteroidetes bacterium]|nr:tRNA (adenosine(37)-N6)-threonylcarbamoyltransferase complex dimerization subunit type 1 TsaB [Bacteroidota bacterium]